MRLSSPRSPRLALVPLAGLALLLAGAPPAFAQEATPQRPSLSFNAGTVEKRVFEMEWGGVVTEESSALPGFLKYGFTDWLEGELGFDAVRQVDLGPDEVTSRGDLWMGVRGSHHPRWEGPALAWVGWVKAPTARDDAGSGEADAGFIGIASGPLPEGLTLDLNIGLSALGTDGGAVGRQEAIATLGIPILYGWSAYVEGAYQNTAVLGDGLFFDAGVTYTASPLAVFDVAGGVGSSRGYPDWQITLGWTLLTSDGR